MRSSTPWTLITIICSFTRKRFVIWHENGHHRSRVFCFVLIIIILSSVSIWKRFLWYQAKAEITAPSFLLLGRKK